MIDQSEACWAAMPGLIADVVALGERLQLPYIAAQSDLGDPEPMADRDGRPYAETSFRWIDPSYHYWRDRRLALQAPFLTAARLIAEPFYYSAGALRSWRPTSLLDAIDCGGVETNSFSGEAIIAPVHLPRGLVGAVVWCSRDRIGVSDIFRNEAEHVQSVALRLVATHSEATARPRTASAPHALSRREVQCLRWAAAGKTDAEIGIILSLSVSTVRFHLRNASGKLGTTGRAQAIQVAAGFGFIGGRVA